MARKKKEYANVGIKMDANVSELLEQYCLDSGMSKTAVIERAVKRYIESEQKSKRDV